MFGAGELEYSDAANATISVQVRRTKVLAFRDNLFHGIEHVATCGNASVTYYTFAQGKDSAVHPVVIGPRATEDEANSELPPDFTGLITTVGFGRLGAVISHRTEHRENGLVGNRREQAEPTGDVTTAHVERAVDRLGEIFNRVSQNPTRVQRNIPPGRNLNDDQAAEILQSLLDAGLTPADIEATLATSRQASIEEEMRLTGHDFPTTTTPPPDGVPTTTSPGPNGGCSAPPQPRTDYRGIETRVAAEMAEGGIDPH